MSEEIKKRLPRFLIQGILIVLFVGLVFWTNRYAIQNGAIQSAVSQLGYLGIFLFSIASGFNLIVPIPIVSFFPFFLSAGFHPIPTVLVISLGMTVGDALGYLIGRAGRDIVSPRSKTIVRRIEALQSKHALLPYIGIFLYAAFSPLPNELIVIPLAFLGFRMWKVMLAVFAGNCIFNALAAFGFAQFFSLFS